MSKTEKTVEIREVYGYEFTDALELHVIELKKRLTGEGEVE